MRSPSPRRRFSPGRKRPFRRGKSMSRSRSRSRDRRPQSRRSPSPKYRRSSPGRRSPKRSRSPRRSSLRTRFPRRSKSPRRSRSPPRRSKSPTIRSPPRRSRSPPRRRSPNVRGRPHSRERFEPKTLQMDRPHPRPNLVGRALSSSQSGPGPGPGIRGFNASPEKTGHPHLSSPPNQRDDFDPYCDNSGGHDDKDYRTLPPAMAQTANPKERFDQTSITINDRFLMITGPLPPFSPTDNITIGIERNIPGNEPAIIRLEIYPAEVVLVRRKDEGIQTLSQRMEFREPKQEYAEKRTIKVADSHKRKTHVMVDESIKRPLLTDRWTIKQRAESPVEMYKKQEMTREELDSYILQAPVPTSSRHGDRDDRMLSRDRRFTVNISNEPDEAEDFWSDKEKTKKIYDPKDLRHNLSKKRDKDDVGMDARQKLLKKRENELRKREDELKRRSAMLERKEKELTAGEDEEEKLPDFAKRPDRFQFNELQPEITPKGGYYYEVKTANMIDKPVGSEQPRARNKTNKPYGWQVALPRAKKEYVKEHDNRESFGFYRGRGRGFRGRPFPGSRGVRGGFRGSFRGRGGRGGFTGARGGFTDNRNDNRNDNRSARRDSASREWKHDKFEEMDDEKPTSTTKN